MLEFVASEEEDLTCGNYPALAMWLLYGRMVGGAQVGSGRLAVIFVGPEPCPLFDPDVRVNAAALAAHCQGIILIPGRVPGRIVADVLC
jgi:hypothetical protein